MSQEGNFLVGGLSLPQASPVCCFRASKLTNWLEQNIPFLEHSLPLHGKNIFSINHVIINRPSFSRFILSFEDN